MSQAHMQNDKPFGHFIMFKKQRSQRHKRFIFTVDELVSMDRPDDHVVNVIARSRDTGEVTNGTIMQSLFRQDIPLFLLKYKMLLEKGMDTNNALSNTKNWWLTNKALIEKNYIQAKEIFDFVEQRHYFTASKLGLIESTVQSSVILPQDDFI